MPLSWNEIKTRAAAFSNKWKEEANEDAEAKSFWDDFFNIFGISRYRVASFEKAVRKTDDTQGYIDLLWKGVILIEHKSRGKNLDKAFAQAKDYFPGLKEKELPRYILVCDFETFRLYDLENNHSNQFALSQLKDNVALFGFIAGYEKKTYKEQDPVNIEAAELMGRLHDKLKAIGYCGHQLELYLVRLVFCLFADDSNIFEKGIFNEYLDNKTAEDGSDLAMHNDSLFTILNTAEENRLKNIDESLAVFPYVNGKLFEERLAVAAFDSDMRKTLLDCCLLDWGKISPAIFGSLFQSVMDEKARRNLGAHYTSEKNILKLIKPLFLDELHTEFEKTKNNKAALQRLHDKISGLRFLDPACGCGNFLIIAYREIRLLEIEIIKQLLKLQGYREEVLKGAQMDASYLIKCNVDQFYGIEYEEFPAQIAKTALWLTDHQMNMKVTETFGEYYVRLPLKKSATILQGNALRIDWQSLIDPIPFEKGEAVYDYILGNPPFVGYAWQNAEQKKDMDAVFAGVNGAGVLDYVTAWYILAAKYIQGKQTKCAFVSTNSISQGEQVGILWNELYNNYKIKIFFAHRTFSWSNEAKGNAAVHVVIIGFANFEIDEKRIFEYEHIKGEPHEIVAKNINSYLVDAKNVFILKRTKPISKVPEINRGSDAIDDGNLLLNLEEKNDLIEKEPKAEKWIRPFLMGKEFLNNIPRFCLWLKNISPQELKEIPLVYERVQKVKLFREKSKRPQTLKAAMFPTLFGEERHPESDYLAIPKVSSENREYIPIGYCSKDIICGDKLFNLPNASLFHFGIITSLMHNTWMRYTCGRMKSDYSYSNTIVYNNYPWPENPSDKQKEAVEKAAQAVLDARSMFPESSLADLYDPNTMPPALVKAHQQLDKAVDLCYRPQPFPNETKRIEFLFELYDRYTAGLFTKEKKGRKKVGKK
ncbi:MAG: class I SAM-dependent DNA methyltransferase [Bacteroidetes bacterium]|nr:class I SAM-dependent DNA methyltransferase [Bacteroidota bacterium]